MNCEPCERRKEAIKTFVSQNKTNLIYLAVLGAASIYLYVTRKKDTDEVRS